MLLCQISSKNSLICLPFLFAGKHFEVVQFFNTCTNPVNESQSICDKKYLHSITGATRPSTHLGAQHWSFDDFCPICSDMNSVIWEILLVYITVMMIFRPLQHLYGWYYNIPMLDISHAISITYLDLRITGQLFWNCFIKRSDFNVRKAALWNYFCADSGAIMKNKNNNKYHSINEV